MSDSENKRPGAIDFKLEVPVKIATSDGDHGEADMITLLSPTSRDRKEVSKLKNFYTDIIRRVQTEVLEASRKLTPKEEKIAKAVEDKKKKRDAEDKKAGKPKEGFTIKDMALFKGQIDIDDARQDNVYDWFRTLFVANNKAMFGDTKMTGDLFDDLDFDDMEDLCNTYAVSFLIPSLVN